MAEQQAANDAGEQARSKSSGVIGTIASGLSTAWNAVTKDGFLAAAWRQGINELASALKPFPESISADVPGTLWNPTQGEIAKARDVSGDGPPHPWPSEVAQETRNQPVSDNSHNNANGMDGGNSM